MRLTLLTSLLLNLLFTSASTPPQQQPSPASAPPPLQTLTIHHLPVSAPPLPPAKPLATLIYSPAQPDLSRLQSFTPPPNNTSLDDLTQLGFYPPNTPRLRTSATATYSFHAPYEGRFRIVVKPESGECVGVSWRAWRAKDEGEKHGKGKGRWDGRGDFDVVTMKDAPMVVFDKPAKGKGGSTQQQGVAPGMEGEEEVVEKTFLQKYWWLLLGVAVLAMTGGGPEK